MSWFSKIFGGGASEAAQAHAEEYEGFSIRPDPVAEGGRFRIGAVIEKDGKTHRMIRADVLESRDAAASASVAKAKALIDQQGDSLFGQPG